MSISFRRSWVLLPIDMFIVVFSIYISYELRFGFFIPLAYQRILWQNGWMGLVIYTALYAVFRMYTRIWRYAGTADLVAIFLSNSFAAIFLKVFDMAISSSISIPLSVWMSSYLLTVALTGGIRLGYRIYAHKWFAQKTMSHRNPVARNILIYGAGSAGSIVSKEIMRDHEMNQKVIGFIDDDVSHAGMMLNGSRVHGNRSMILSIIQQHNVHQILVAIPSLSRRDLTDLVQELEQYKIPIFIIPPFTRWMVDNLWGQAKPVDVEDLLGRDPLPVDVMKVGTYVSDAVVLVTGAGGSIGSEICRQVAQLHPRELILLGRGENSIFEIKQELQDAYPHVRVQFVIGDIRDAKKMETVVSTMRPTVIYHAAAHKHVPLMEEHPDEAFMNNVMATKQLAYLAVRFGVHYFISISSDKAVRPTNVMGSSKRIAEMVIQDIAETSNATKFVTVRFGNVLGSRGSVVKILRQQIAKGGPVTVTDERMVRYFMTIPEAVRLVIEAGAVGENGRVYLLDMGEPVRISYLAEQMIRLSGYEPGIDIKIEYTGIRPGEKLFEELSRESDSVNVGEHTRIWSVKCPVMPHDTFSMRLMILQRLYEKNDRNGLALALKELAWWEPFASDELAQNEVFAESLAFHEVAATFELP